MSKYRVKSGIHMIGERLVRAGDCFELENDAFLKTSGRSDLFEAVLPTEQQALVQAAEEDEGVSYVVSEGRVAKTENEAVPPAPSVPPKRGRKPKQKEQDKAPLVRK